MAVTDRVGDGIVDTARTWRSRERQLGSTEGECPESVSPASCRLGDLDGDGITELCATIGLGTAFKVLTVQPVPHLSFCSPLVNSTGGPATLQASGFASVSGNDLVLHLADAPASTSSIFFFGVSEDSATLGDGLLCAGGPFMRLSVALTSSAAGTVDHAVDLTSLWSRGHVGIGMTLYCQGWFRDATPGGSKPSNGLRVHTVH